MPKLSMFILSASLIGVLTLGGVVCAQQEREQRRRVNDAQQEERQRRTRASTELEFVCYEDGKLVERHVGVSEADEKVSGPAWKITYVEGGYAIYAQKEGESCQVEAIGG